MQTSHLPTGDGAPARRRLFGRAPRTRSVIAATGLLIICSAPFAAARTGDNLREGVRNGTTTSETEIIANIATTTANKGGYAMRMSNLSATGGGFINGCRASAAATSKPCYRANNLSTGRAFEFNSNHGEVVGTITAGGGGDTKKPFTTNATGVATGLNADRVDGLDAAQILTAARLKTGLDADTVDGKDATELQARFAQVSAGGTAGETRGVPADGVAGPAGAGTYQVTFTGDLTKCALSATVTGTDPGQVTVTPTLAAGNTTVAVHTFNGAGVAADRGFHLSVHC